jgi:hypothetical protein
MALAEALSEPGHPQLGIIKERNFVPIGGERQSINQDAIVKLYGWAGNLTTSNASLQGILSGS